MRFRFPVGAKETRSLVVEEVRMLPATYSISDLEDKTIAVFVGQKTITPEMEKALRGVLARRNATRELEVRSAALEEERERIREDQNRIRENMKALRGSPEEKSLLLRYTQQLNAQEDRLQTLETEIRKAEDAAEQARQELSRYIESLIFEASL
jgi:chromosome segregation ATPase